jgi:hypothetical protein
LIFGTLSTFSFFIKRERKMTEPTRHVLRLALLISPALAVAVGAWTLLLMGPGVFVDATSGAPVGVDVGSLLLCLCLQSLAILWSLACAAVYVDRDLRASLLVKRLLDVDHLRDVLREYEIHLEPASTRPSEEPSAVSPTAVPCLDRAIDEHERAVRMGRAAGERDVALRVLQRFSQLDELGAGPRKKGGAIAYQEATEDVCLLCADALGMEARRVNETLPAGLREVLRQMRYRQQKRTRRRSARKDAPTQEEDDGFYHLRREEEEEHESTVPSAEGVGLLSSSAHDS